MERLVLEIVDGIATVTVNKPESFNALDPEMLEALHVTFEKIDNDDDVVAVVVTGAGNKAFVGGADIKTILTSTVTTSKAMSKLGQSAYEKITHCRKPVIAAVNGIAYGGGFELANSCDIRLASENAKFGALEVIWGIMPAWTGTQRLPQLIGRSDAMKILLTGDVFDANEAYRIGLVSGVYPQDELMDRAYELAKKIVKNGKVNTSNIKRAVAEGADGVTKTGLALEAELAALCFTVDVPKQRAEAFLSRNKNEK